MEYYRVRSHVGMANWMHWLGSFEGMTYQKAGIGGFGQPVFGERILARLQQSNFGVLEGGNLHIGWRVIHTQDASLLP
jgi:hypothetical protein